MEKQDLRVTKTYTALSNAFWDLIQKKTFSEITVNELCDKAFVRRQTFYKHFTDKYDFLSFIILRILQQSKKEPLMQNDLSKTKEYPDYFIDNFLHTLKQIIELIDANHNLLENIDLGYQIFILMKNVMHSMDEEIRNLYQEMVEFGYRLPSDVELLTQFFIGSVHQIIMYWYLNRTTISKEEIMERTSTLIKEIFFS